MSNDRQIEIFTKLKERWFSIALWLTRTVASISMTYQERGEKMDSRLLKIWIAFVTVFKSVCHLLWSSLRSGLLLCLDTSPSNPNLSLKNFKSIYSSPHARGGIEKHFWNLSSSPEYNFSFIFLLKVFDISHCVKMYNMLIWYICVLWYDCHCSDSTTITSHNYHFFACGWNNDIYFLIYGFIFHILPKSKKNKYFVIYVETVQVQSKVVICSHDWPSNRRLATLPSCHKC